MLKELRPYLAIKEKLKILAFLKALLENIIVMLMWFSCIFKQDIYSFLLFIMLVVHTYKRSQSTMTITRVTVLILLFIQYLSQVVDFSSYNSRMPFPQVITGKDSNVYPNAKHFYFKVPLFISLEATEDEQGIYQADEIDLQSSTFWGLMVTSKSLQGIWFDVSVAWTVSIYYSLCNLWLLFRPYKIIQSKKS